MEIPQGEGAKTARVLIAFGSKIVSDALKQYLEKCDCGPECSQTVTIDPGSGFPPAPAEHQDIILTDHLTLRKIPKELFEKARVLVMDFGMEREAMAALFVTEKLAGVIHAATDISMLCKAIRAAHRGEVWIDNATIRSLVNNKVFRQGRGEGHLSERETALAKLVKEGYRNKEIASLLSISEQTVKAHLNHIFRKMHVAKRSDLIKKLADSEKS